MARLDDPNCTKKEINWESLSKVEILIRGIVVAGAAAVAGAKFLIANLDKVYLAGRRGRGGGFQYIKE